MIFYKSSFSQQYVLLSVDVLQFFTFNNIFEQVQNQFKQKDIPYKEKRMYFIEKIKNNNRNVHFIMYCFSFIIYGAIMNCLGPLIPFLSKQYGIPQTRYSIFFTVRTIAAVSGAIGSKYFIDKYSPHKILATSNILTLFGSLLFSSDLLAIQSISIFLHTFFLILVDPILNMILMNFNSDPDKQFWLLMGHTMFGIGCFVGPILVYFVQLKIFIVLGLLNVLTVVPYLILESPSTKKKLSEIRISQDSNQKKQTQKLRKGTIYLIGFIFFIYIGQQVTFGGWIASYAVMLNATDEKTASIITSFFYIFITVTRFIFGIIQPKKISDQIRALFIFKIFTSIILILVSIYSPLASCYLGGVLYGICLAPLYAKLIILPSQFGFELNGQDYTTIVLFGAFAEAGLATVAGILIGYTPHMLFFCLLAMAIGSYVLFQGLIDLFHSKQQNRLLKGDVNQDKISMKNVDSHSGETNLKLLS